MAKLQRSIKPKIKQRLYEETGNKCANPGCSVWRSHIHHIKQWAVYKVYNAPDMVAICSSCHDEVHHGVLGTTDEVYILRSPSFEIDFLIQCKFMWNQPLF